MVRFSIFIIALAAFFAAAPAFAANYVVVKSQEAAWLKPGDIIDSSKMFVLPEKASITLINSSGLKIRIDGPFSGNIDKAAGGKAAAVSKKSGSPTGLGLGMKVDVIQNLSRLFKTAMVDSGSFGVFRGVGDATGMPETWMVNVAESGDYCVKKRQAVTLWRPKKGSAKDLTLVSIETRQKTKVSWPSGADRISWPVEIPISDGATYQAQIGGLRGPVKLTLHMVPDDLPTRSHQATWMTGKKCDKQALLLIVSMDIDIFINEQAAKGQF